MQRQQRRLGAILAADVVGYSRLMGRDESGTLERLKAHRSERLMPALARNAGRLVKIIGDGAIVEFASAVAALAAAVEIQQAMADANQREPEVSRVVFRIGLHLGDLIVEGDDLYGDGVNIAARLEAAAPPGGVLVSRAVKEAAQGRLEVELVPLGELQLKNIDRPVRAFRVEWKPDDWRVAESSAAAPTPATAGSDRPSIAVLPFANLSGDPEQDYFADGVSEDIVTALSRFHELVVISRSSSFAFKGKGLDVRQVAGQLGVRYVLNGSLRKAGNRLRVSAELTDATTGAQVWSDRYDRDLADVFELQDDISRAVAAMIEPAIRGAEIGRARRKPPAGLTAYDLYLKALPHLWAGTRDDIPKAIGLLRQSLVLDAAAAPALAALSMALLMASPSGAQASPEMGIEAVALARRAVEVDATDAFAQAVYGYTLAASARDYAQGRLHAQEAVRLNRNSAFAWGVLGFMNSLGGDFESAIAELQCAMTLSPYDNLLSLWTLGLAAACFGLGRYGEGITWARKSVQQNPGSGTSHRLLAANLAAAGQLAEAREVTARRDIQQKTTIGELRALQLFRHDETMERYLAIQREIGVPE